MTTKPPVPCPLPEHPLLAEAAAALNDAGHWGWIVDDQWRDVYTTDETRLTLGVGGELAQWPIGHTHLSSEWVSVARRWLSGGVSTATLQSFFAGMAPYMLGDIVGGRDTLRDMVDPCFSDMVDGIIATDQVAGLCWLDFPRVGGLVRVPAVVGRIRDTTGHLVGSTVVLKPATGMSTIGAMNADGDLRHFERMQRVSEPARRPAGILFADLEGSTQLARTMSTAAYFSLGRRLVRTADRCIVDAGGMVGRHVGDGIVAFFLAETAGSESAAASACIRAARALRSAIDEVALASELSVEDVVLRFGLHWGSTLYVGNIITAGRTEVTALGDEVNEAARIEACATGGRALASKSLLERLDPTDAAGLGLDPDHATYTRLADLATATDKARRDAPAIAVHDI